MNVLIIDDAAFMRITIKNILERHGFEVAGEGENGKIGVEKYIELKPDVVTLDITMPEMDGIAALKEIKKYDPYAKVIMASAMGQEAMVIEAITAGAKNFLVKPFKEETLIQALNALK